MVAAKKPQRRGLCSFGKHDGFSSASSETGECLYATSAAHALSSLEPSPGSLRLSL